MSAIESSMIWAPVEAMTQACRNSQKLVAKDFPTLLTSIKALQTTLAATSTPSSSSSASSKDSKSSAAITAEQLSSKQKIQMMKTLQGMLKEAQTLKKKLDDAGKVASKQSQLCSSRLHYLAQVDHLLDSSKNHLQYEHAEDDNSDEGEKAADDEGQVTDGSQLPLKGDSSVVPSPASSQSMEVDSSPTPASNVTSLNKVASKKDNHSDSSEFEVTPRMRLDRLFVDYLLRNNRFDTAELLLSSSPRLANLVDPDIFHTADRITRSLIQEHDCTKALLWCGENRSRLNKIQSTLEFNLRLQEFLILVERKQSMKAIEYARKHLAPATIITPTPNTTANTNTQTPSTNPPLTRHASLPVPPTSNSGLLNRANSVGPSPSNEVSSNEATSTDSTSLLAEPMKLKVLQMAMNLLVFFGVDDDDDAKGLITPSSIHDQLVWDRYRAYFSPTRFNELGAQFHRALLSIHGLNDRSDIESMMNIGLSAIKTGECRCSHQANHSTKQSNKKRKGDDNHNRDDTNNTIDSSIQMDIDSETGKSSPSNSDPINSSSSSQSPSPSPSSPPTSGWLAAASATLSNPLVGSSSVDCVSLTCPTCIPPLSCLSVSLPIAPRTHSRLICRMSGALMDDNNPPMALPNGYVYSKNALNEMAKHNHGMVTCIRTKQQFQLTEARIAYVL